jgi:aldehyde dehydrogenase (NAD+)
MMNSWRWPISPAPSAWAIRSTRHADRPGGVRAADGEDLGFIEGAGQEGAQALVGGARMARGWRMAFIEPTIFTGVTDEMTIAREEIFGPVLSAFAFDTEEEVLKRANATPFGLGSGCGRAIFTAHRMARGIQAGSVWINCYQMLDPGVPFGG